MAKKRRLNPLPPVVLVLRFEASTGGHSPPCTIRLPFRDKF